uniref:Uncharacterized protein n=1 Tax=Curvibacter symbiont subsp. Hydra magnipapillata TaxID=667019 RepID=C9YFH0_CURXX|nr:hypothetical protein Csp_D33260 [Curvibacter putative symbiont of Hydra magnipapillata]
MGKLITRFEDPMKPFRITGSGSATLRKLISSETGRVAFK